MFWMLFRDAPPGSRRRRFARWWRDYAGSIAFVCLILIAAIGFARIENSRYEGCQGGNLLRKGLREDAHRDIVETEHANPEFFPDIPPDEFKRLVRKSIHHSEHLIRVNYADRECGTRIDLPLTGAAIVLPP